MFGYVMVNKPELKIREFARYKGFYCGLCRTLHKQHGRRGQLTLTYDMTFLVILLSSLYEPATREERRRCVIHPAKKQYMLYNKIQEYAADMNVLLMYDHLRDNWEDEKKISAYLGMRAFAGKKRKIERQYPRQANVIRESLRALAEREDKNCQELDAAARPFGELMSELFVWQEDAFQTILRSFGFYLGKFIYIMDAWVDLEEDYKRGCYNPFLEKRDDENLDERVREILDGTLRMAIAEFEKLPCEQDLPILRNILYEGVWSVREQNREKQTLRNGG